MLVRGLFVAGSDTGVGKTLVTGGLAACLRSRGFSTGVMKPVETGCPARRETRCPRDGMFLRFMARAPEPLERIGPYRLKAPLAPQAAAALEGRRVSLERLRRGYVRISANHDITLLEGAGGMLVPLNSRFLMIDLVAALKIPVLLVTRISLGTLNHTLLTLESLARRRVPVAGVVFNNPEGARGPAVRTNPDLFRHWSPVPVLGSIPHVPGLRATRPHAVVAAELVRKHLDLEQLVSKVTGGKRSAGQT